VPTHKFLLGTNSPLGLLKGIGVYSDGLLTKSGRYTRSLVRGIHTASHLPISATANPPHPSPIVLVAYWPFLRPATHLHSTPTYSRFYSIPSYHNKVSIVCCQHCWCNCPLVPIGPNRHGHGPSATLRPHLHDSPCLGANHTPSPRPSSPPGPISIAKADGIWGPACRPFLWSRIWGRWTPILCWPLPCNASGKRHLPSCRPAPVGPRRDNQLPANPPASTQAYPVCQWPSQAAPSQPLPKRQRQCHAAPVPAKSTSSWTHVRAIVWCSRANSTPKPCNNGLSRWMEGRRSQRVAYHASPPRIATRSHHGIQPTWWQSIMLQHPSERLPTYMDAWADKAAGKGARQTPIVSLPSVSACC